MCLGLRWWLELCQNLEECFNIERHLVTPLLLFKKLHKSVRINNESNNIYTYPALYKNLPYFSHYVTITMGKVVFGLGMLGIQASSQIDILYIFNSLEEKSFFVSCPPSLLYMKPGTFDRPMKSTCFIALVNWINKYCPNFLKEMSFKNFRIRCCYVFNSLM